MAVGICRLCGRTDNLQLSHIVPGFVYRYFRQRSITGFMREVAEINRRVQDGERLSLLCTACEQRFGRWERQFRDNVFFPFHERQMTACNYGSWFSRFVASVTWRVLLARRELGQLQAEYSEPVLGAFEAALGTWRNFLLGRTYDFGPYFQCIIPLDGASVAHGRSDVPNNLSRAISNEVVYEIGGWADEGIYLVHAKLIRLLLIGVVVLPSSIDCTSVRVHPGHGVFLGRTPTIPEFVWELMKVICQTQVQGMARMSPTQREVVREAFERNRNRIPGSEQQRAIHEDLGRSGRLP
jgi:hypothetical protein